MSNEPIVISYNYAAPVERVWKAITDKNQMKEWYFDIPGFEPSPGCEFNFRGGDEKQYLHLGKVITVVPKQTLVYSWRYEGFPGNSFVHFRLQDEGGNTKLTLTHEGLETFPAENGDFKKENFVTGWTYILKTSLADFLEKMG